MNAITAACKVIRLAIRYLSQAMISAHQQKLRRLCLLKCNREKKGIWVTKNA